MAGTATTRADVPSLASTASPGAGGDPVLLAAGDIADCGDGAAATAALIAEIDGAVAALGDNAYESGSADEYAACFDPTWGQFKDRIHPVPGNHEYETRDAADYFAYFGAAAGTPGEGWYSYDLGSWHVVALNSNCGKIGGCNAGSPQEQWLRADLAAHPVDCTLAYWHHPRFSSGMHGNNERVAPLWQALADAGADVVLSGHDHDYERFMPQSPDGHADAQTGIREFVVGTGGSSLRDFEHLLSTSESRTNDTWGVLKLTLHPEGYGWEFLAVTGETPDTGTGTCH